MAAGIRNCIAFAVLSISLAGCSIPISGDDTTTRYVVVGFGVFNVDRPVPGAEAPVLSSKALGITMTPSPQRALYIGYADATTYTLPNNFAYVAPLTPLTRTSSEIAQLQQEKNK